LISGWGMKRNKILLIVTISLGILSLKSYAQDNLTKGTVQPDNKHIQQYHIELQNILSKNLVGTQIIQTIIYSSPERAISIEEDSDDKYYLVDRCLNESLWSYKMLEIEGPPVTIQEDNTIQRNEYPAIDKSLLIAKKQNIGVTIHKTVVDDEFVIELQSIWEYYIKNAINKSDSYGGVDGRNYLFQTFQNNSKSSSAEIWSPIDSSKTWYLVKLTESLTEYIITDSSHKSEKLTKIKSLIQKIKRINNITPNSHIGLSTFNKSVLLIILSIVFIAGCFFIVMIINKKQEHKKLC
jgi:hypothetical protein